MSDDRFSEELDEVATMMTACAGIGLDTDAVDAMVAWSVENRELLANLVTLRRGVEAGTVPTELWDQLVIASGRFTTTHRRDS